MVLIERDRERCDFLAGHLKQTVVVHRDATRRAILEEERVSSADVFVACTGDDEDNIMASVEARDIGSDMIMALVSRPDYAHVVGKLGIDLAVSPREVVAKQVLGFLTNGPIVSRTPLSEGSHLSVLEIDVKDDSPAIEHVLANLGLPPQTLIAAVIREGFASVPGGDYQFEPGDTVIALVDDEVIEAIEGVF